MAGRKKSWSRKEVLQRLMRIAEEAKEATWLEKADKNGNCVREYDARCASIELKAVEYAVKLSGLLEQEEEGELVVTMSEQTKDLAV